MYLGIQYKLSKAQQDFLMDHVDGVRPMSENHLDVATRTSLMTMGLVRFDEARDLQTARPSGGTRLTERGRDALCGVLAHFAECLQRASNAKDEKILALLPRGYGWIGVQRRIE